jgi:uncharacterized protein (TIGR00725 family)
MDIAGTPGSFKDLVGVIGAATASPALERTAEACGALLARNGYAVVCGGLSGVMAAASRGAAEAGGTVIGILPGPEPADANPWVTFAVATNMGHARNAIIAHSARFLVAVGGEAGTLSEIAFGLKLGRPVYSIGSWRIQGVRQLADVEELAAVLAEDGWLQP